MTQIYNLQSRRHQHKRSHLLNSTCSLGSGVLGVRTREEGVEPTDGEAAADGRREGKLGFESTQSGC